MNLNQHIHQTDKFITLTLFFTMGLFTIGVIPISIMIPQAAAEPTPELEDNKQVSDNSKNIDDFEDDEEKMRHQLKGFIELENYISTYTEQDFANIFKKNEIRNYLNYRYGNDTIFFEVDMNLYATPHLFSDDINNEYIYSEKFEVARNLRISTAGFELNFQKLYFNFEFSNCRMRIGNQVHSWGTADVFSSTSYFNPNDLREFLIKDEDELKQSIPTLSVLITFGDDSLEIILAPVHVPVNTSDSQNFWGIQYQEGPFPVTMGKPEAMNLSILNTGLGVQYYTNKMGIDIYASLYHGPDKEPVMRPLRTIIEPNQPVSIYIGTESYTMDAIGIALSKSIDKFVFQFEGIYSPDRVGVVEQNFEQLITLPYDIRRSHFISYSAGANYFIPLSKWIQSHEGDSIITLEWSQSRFINDEIMKPMITDILSARFDDTFINNKLKTSLTGIIDVSNGGFIIIPGVEYKFNFGLSINISYVYINSNNESYIGYFSNNDILILRARYEY